MTGKTPIRLSARPPVGEPVVGGRVSVAIGGEPMIIDVEVPAGPTTLQAMLPVFHGLANLLVERAEARVAAEGRTISCRKGCGACCRKALLVTEAEARAVAAVVEAMPEPRRSIVRSRFEAGEQRVAAAGLNERLTALAEVDDAESSRTGQDYFRLGIACPFLEDEACSIHPVRPLNCREYLVTTPASACAEPTPEGVRRIGLEGLVSTSLLGLAKDVTANGWVVMIRALSFVRENPQPAPERPGPEWVEAGFRRLSGK